MRVWSQALLAQGQIQPLQRLLHRLMGRETGAFMASGLQGDSLVMEPYQGDSVGRGWDDACEYGAF